MKRRDSLRLGALGGGALLLPACEKIVSEAADRIEPFPEQLDPALGERIDEDFHLLSRAAFGPRPGDLARLRKIGREAWIDEQLEPGKIRDTMCELRAGGFESLHVLPEIAYEFKKPVLRREIVRHTLLRAVFSKRQLFEVMTGFWTDHFNIDLEKGDCIFLKPWDDTNVIRRHALGKFRDLVRASATSPAMLVYLDGNQNKVRGADDRPNENYARELLELHTMGVGNGYTQRDILEAARALSGWRFKNKGHDRWIVFFEPDHHDDGEKTVLGERIPAGGGETDVDRLVDIVCAHPATAKYVARKLCVRFVGYDPPAALVDRVTGVYAETEGDIAAMVRTILLSQEFSAPEARGAKLKRPFRFIVSALRGTGADTHAHDPLIKRLLLMGQGPFQYPTPDGYPDEELPWLGTLLWRWNFAFELAGRKLPAVDFNLGKLALALGLPAADKGSPPRVERLFAHLCGRRPDAAEADAIAGLAAAAGNDRRRTEDLVGVLLASPAFQRT